VLKNGQASDGSITVSGTNSDGSIPIAGTNPDGTVPVGALGSTGSSSAGAVTSDVTAGGTAVAAVTKALSAGGGASGIGSVLSGMSSVFSGNAVATVLGEGTPGVNGNAGVDPSTGQRVGAGVALAGTVAAGVMATISQISKGGPQGIIGGIGAAAGTAAAEDPDPLSKGILGGVAAVAGLVDALFPNARTQYQNNVNQAMQQDQFVAAYFVQPEHGRGGQSCWLQLQGRNRGHTVSGLRCVAGRAGAQSVHARGEHAVHQRARHRGAG